MRTSGHEGCEAACRVPFPQKCHLPSPDSSWHLRGSPSSTERRRVSIPWAVSLPELPKGADFFSSLGRSSVFRLVIFFASIALPVLFSCGGFSRWNPQNALHLLADCGVGMGGARFGCPKPFARRRVEVAGVFSLGISPYLSSSQVCVFLIDPLPLATGFPCPQPPVLHLPVFEETFA